MNPRGREERRASDAFDAFISYGHAADGRLAPALQTGLERLASPWYRRRILRVFRDDTGLSVNPDLWGSIRDALDRSEWFVLLLSPQAAASHWVNEEITHWLSAKSPERILLVQTDGALVWDPEQRDFDPERSTCIPPALVGRLHAEPRHLDLSWARDESQLDRRHPRFRDNLADLAAPIHGVPKDEIESEDVRQYRRNIRARRAAFAGLVTLLALAVATSVVALTQRNRAQHQTDVAVSQRLAIQAASIAPRKLDLALLLAVAAYRLNDSPQTGQGLLAALSQSPQLRGFDYRLGRALGTMTLSPDRRALLVVEQSGTVHMVDVETDRPLRQAAKAHVGSALETAFSPNGKWLAIAGDRGTQIYDAQTLAPIGRLLLDEGAVEWRAFSPDSASLATSTSKGWVRVRRTADWQPIAPPLRISPSRTTSITFSPDGRRLLVGTHEGTVAVLDAHTLKRTEAILRVAGRGEAYAVAFSPDGTTLVTGGEDGTLTLWDGERLRRRGHTLRFHDSAIYAAAFSPDSRLVASSDDVGQISVWRTADGTRVGPALRGHAGLVFDLAFASNRRLISAAEGELARWDVGSVLLGSQLQDEEGPIGALAIAPDETELVTARPHGGALARVSLRGAGVRLLASGLRRVEAIDWSPDGHAIFIAGATRAVEDESRDGRVTILSAKTNRALGSASIGKAGALSLDVSPDGTRFAVGDTFGRVSIWDARTFRRVGRVLSAGPTRITTVAFSPDGKSIASGNGYGHVELWRVADGAKLWQHVAPSIIRALRWRPDGRSVLAAGVTLGRLAADTGRRAGSEIAPGVGEARSLAVSGDGSEAVIGSITGRISIIDLESGDVRYALAGHTGRVNGVAFVNKGRTIISAGDDGAVLARAIDPDVWQRRACAEAGRILSPDEARSYGVKDANVCRDGSR